MVLEMDEGSYYDQVQIKRLVLERRTKKRNMCIAACVWQAHPLYPLLVLNRDEFHDRPIKAVGWLGGGDVVGGGTWMGCTKNGRLAFLTNVLEPDSDPLPNAKTRGDLPLTFLQGRMSPLEYAEQVSKEADDNNGFNMIVADLCTRSMFCRIGQRENQSLLRQFLRTFMFSQMQDTPWHKAQHLGKNFRKLLQKHGEEEISAREMAEKLMTDTMEADMNRLTNTGCDFEWERQLSPIFVEVDTKLGRYGTRSTAVLSVNPNWKVSFYEKNLERGGVEGGPV